MEKEAEKGQEDYKPINTFRLVLTGTLLFFVVTVITFAIILYSVYFFTLSFLNIIFRIVVALMGIATYYLLITEFIGIYSKKRS